MKNITHSTRMHKLE